MPFPESGWPGTILSIQSRAVTTMAGSLRPDARECSKRLLAVGLRRPEMERGELAAPLSAARIGDLTLKHPVHGGGRVLERLLDGCLDRSVVFDRQKRASSGP